MDDALLPIGMFSRASLLSVKTLRAYHQSGLLVPASVDPRTNYRSYTVDQLADAAIIVRLRALDLPLEAVREVLAKRDPDHTRAVLAEHRATMEARLAETERIVAELQSDGSALTHTPAHVRIEPLRPIIRIVATVAAADMPSFFSRAFQRLETVTSQAGGHPAGPPGGIFPAAVEADAERVEAILPLAEPITLPAGSADVETAELPAAEVAVLVHQGDFTTMGTTYRALGAWVATHASHIEEPVREWYLAGPEQSSDPDTFRTEIAWPIEPGSAVR